MDYLEATQRFKKSALAKKSILDSVIKNDYGKALEQIKANEILFRADADILFLKSFSKSRLYSGGSLHSDDSLFALKQCLLVNPTYDKALLELIAYFKNIFQEFECKKWLHRITIGNFRGIHYRELMAILGDHLNQKNLKISLINEPSNYNLLTRLAHETGVTWQKRTIVSSRNSLEKSIGHHSFAKIIEKTGDHQKAFARFLFSKKIQWDAASPALKRDANQLRDNIQKIATFLESRAVPQSEAGTFSALSKTRTQRSARNVEQIFILGFPRSGTTLVEQIFATHDDVCTSLEADNLFNSFHHVMSHEKIRGVLTQLFHGGIPDIERVRRKYISRFEANICSRGETVKRIRVDKLPANSFISFYANMLFPDAVFIIPVRRPNAVLVSCLKQRFEENAFMLNLSTIERCSQIYLNTMRILLRSFQQSDARRYTYKFEDLVQTPNRIVSEISNVIGLDFLPNFQNFSDIASRRPITTPSKSKVTEKLNTEAIDNWQTYATFLTPAHDQINEIARMTGYPTNTIATPKPLW
jgi:hypothetical protein